MEPECYKVKVVHFISPYFIWVEVPDLDPENTDKFCFEQIGVYGVLPLDLAMDPVEDTLTTRRSQDWMPAVMILMKKLFSEAVEVSFCPVHIDHRTTVFDDNTHKYGEVIIKKPNGKYRLLSKLLVKSGFAIYNEHTFQVELNSGYFKTKMSHNLIKDIVKHLEKKCKAQTAKQTKVFQAAQCIESALTVKNLEAHNKRITNKIDCFEEVLQRKLEDLQMCKDVDQQSSGRASKKNDTSSDTSSFLQRKVKLHRGNQSEKAPNVVNYFMKQHKEDIHALQKPADFPEFDSVEFNRGFGMMKPDEHINQCKEDSNEFKKHTISGISTPNEQHQSVNKLKKLHMACKKVQPIAMEDFEGNKTRKNSESLTVVSIKELQAKNRLSVNDNIDYNEPIKVRKPRKPLSSPHALPSYDIHTEARIAYGPPGMNPNILPCKIVPKDSFIETYDPPERREEGIPMKKEKEDIFNDEDSDVDIGNALQQEKYLNRVPNTQSSESDIVDKKNDVTNNSRVVAKDIPSDVSCDISPQQQHTSKYNNTSSSILKRKLRYHKENLVKKTTSTDSSDTSVKDSSTSIEEDRFNNFHKADDVKNTSQDLDSDDESVSLVIEKLNSEYEPFVRPQEEKQVEHVEQLKNNVNPFKNVDGNVSKFVEKLVTPVLMVHSKMNKRFQPNFSLRDIPFSTFIHIILKNMSIEKPMMLQTITWASILRGYSTFMIAPKNSGKTMGYLPAVCRLVADQDSTIDSVGPISIIVCATSNSVTEIETLAKFFYERKNRVLAIYSGMNELNITTSLLNGCDILICTPAILVRLLQLDFGVDLRRLTSFVLDDCERLSDVFANEIKFFLFKIKEMLKSRIPKELKVQYIVSSRVWCDFMQPLSNKAPDTVICVGAFQECVLYSKANTTVSFVSKDNKHKSVLDFLKGINHSKRTVIVCRTDEEVAELENVLTDNKYVVFACNSEMTVQSLYNLRGSWDDYQEPVIGPILLCLDGNLTHLNVTDAHHLIHYSLPSLFSSFCKRFSVLNDNYPSIFKEDNEVVKIKILLEDSNVEQLPKILHFIKRCTTEVPTVLDKICDLILVEKDKTKALKLVPICDDLLTLGECPDFWNCQNRHGVVKSYDEPQNWVPKEGVVTFKILHYHTAVFYSARLLSHINKGQTHKYPQKYNMLAMKISMYFSRESNKRLHTQPEVGDVCAVSIKQNLFVRCQVVKILNYYQNGKPNNVLVRLTDEEKLEKTRDINLYYLPDELKTTQTHVVHVRLANLQPKDKDITFSKLSMEELKKITEGEEDLYMRGQISLTIGNCVFLESVEACRDLSTLNKTVVLHNFKKHMLEKHAQLNEEHLQKLHKLCLDGGMEVSIQTKIPEASKLLQPAKKLPTPQWAHLENDDLSAVFFASANNPSTFFVRLVKFNDSCSVLVKDIQKYVAENCDTLNNINVGDIVLAKLPDDNMFERARIDEILKDDKVKCFFVDQGDWREVYKHNLVAITEKLIIQLPFQAIECRLVGVRPPGDDWTEFAANWFTNCFEDNEGNLKQIYLKYFTKEMSQHTGGHKYGVVLIDTNSDQDVVINELIMEVNLAQEDDNEIEYLNNLDFNKVAVDTTETLSDVEDINDSWETVSKPRSVIDNSDQTKISLNDVFLKKPIRSVPLVGSDESETSEDRWQINMTEDFMEMFKPVQNKTTTDFNKSNLPAIKNSDSVSGSEVSGYQMPCKNQTPRAKAVNESDTDSSILVLHSPKKVKDLDSDDYTSPESATEKDLLKEIGTKTEAKVAATPLKGPAKFKIEDTKNSADSLRKPKVLWHQKKNAVTIKILLIGVERYDIKIKDRELNFYAIANDTEYGFNLQLYGIIDKKSAIHSNKGQYIWIHLLKVVERNWLTLPKNGGITKWIVYDVDAIDVDASDVESDDEMSRKVIKDLCDQNINTDSDEEDEFLDDVNFGYSR